MSLAGQRTETGLSKDRHFVPEWPCVLSFGVGGAGRLTLQGFTSECFMSAVVEERHEEHHFRNRHWHDG